MGNTFTTPPTVPDTGDIISGRVIKTETLERMGNLSNYNHAHGGTDAVISQAFDRNTCVTQSASYVDLCRWRVPIPSEDHGTIDFFIAAQVSSTGTGTVRFTLTDGDSTAQGSSTISVTSTGSYTVHSVSHSFTSSSSADYVDIVMEGKVATSGTYDLDIQMVCARFTALTSPLASTSEIEPFGLNRLGANQALTARAGVQFRTNINELRNRKRSLLAWSSIENPSSVFSTRGKGPKSLGIGDAFSFQGVQSPLYVGGGQITLWLYVVDISGTKKFSFMNRSFSVSSNGWNEFNFDPSLDSSSLESQPFGISLYKLNPNVYLEDDTLMDTVNRLAVSNSLPRITALSVWSN